MAELRLHDYLVEPTFLWSALAFIALALVSGHRLKAERRFILVVTLAYSVSVTAYLFASLLERAGSTTSSVTVRDFSVFVLGVSFISLAGILAFGTLLPAVGLRLPRIARDVTMGASHVVWCLIFLQWRGVNLAGIIATSAVLTAVIGLSMQDTLGNLISGLTLQLDDSLHVGDWIKLDDLKGQVVETRWRFTAIETNNWETVVIPNSVLIENKYLVLGRRQGQPVQWRRWVYFNVDYRYPPPVVIEAVEKALRAVEIPNVATTPKINCVQFDFADSFAHYAVRYWLTDILKDDPTDSEVRCHIYYALRRSGMKPSIPAAAVFLTEESEARAEFKATHKLQDRVQALQRADLFRELPPEELGAVAAQIQEVPFTRGETITRQGAAAHFLYLLVEGTVEVVVENEQHESARAAEIGPGSYFGEYGAMTGEARDATIVAQTNCLVYRLDKEIFRNLLQGRPKLADELSVVIATRRTERQSVLEGLDVKAHSVRYEENHHHILTSIRALFGLE